MLPGDLPLQNKRLERSLLGSLMVVGAAPGTDDQGKRALGIVRAKDFFTDEHKVVFRVILTLSRRGLHYSMDAVAAYLEQRGRLNDVLSRDDLRQMQSETIFPVVPAEQAIQVRALGEYREAIQAVLDLRQFIETTDNPGRIRAHLREVSAGLDREALVQGATTQTFRDLMATDFPPEIPIVPPLLNAGDCILVVGNSKTGKSIFALQLAMAIASGGEALGELPVAHPRPVLHLNLDDKPSRVKARGRYMLAAYPDDVYPERLEFAHAWPAIDRGGEGMLIAWAEKHPDGVIVIDLLEKIRPLRGGNIYESDYAALAPLSALAHTYGVTVLVVHHTNKQGSGPGQEFDPDYAVSGSVAIRGAVDGHIVFHPTNADLPHSRRVTLKGRDVQASEYQVSWDEFLSGWHWEGESIQHRVTKKVSPQREAIQMTIQEAGRPLAPAEIAERLGKTTNQVYFLLFQMKNATDPVQIIVMPDGTYQHPAEYARTKPAATDSD